MNKELKEEVLHDIDIPNEEKVDLTCTKFIARRISKESLKEMHRKDKLYWKQRSKITCLKEGDWNIAYFVKVASNQNEGII